MSKSVDSPQGTVLVLDPPEVVERKIKRAVTDTETDVRFDPDKKPGVSNLLTLLSIGTGRTIDDLAAEYSQYGPLKADAAAAISETLRPIRERYAELSGDAGEVARVLAAGADKAQAVASATLGRAKQAMGLLPRT
jgi:tryptophanyl-tRNA synthetase